MRIEATFIGEDSLGYVKGQRYTLDVIGMAIERINGEGYCPYSSITAFLKNWTNIKPHS